MAIFSQIKAIFGGLVDEVATFLIWLFRGTKEPMPSLDSVLEVPIENQTDAEMPIELAKLTLAYECKPWRITQPWGVPYNLFGIKYHHGIDVGHGLNRRLRAPFDYEIYRTLWQPKGGGRVLTIVSRETYQSPFGPAKVMVDYLHLDEYIKTHGAGDKGDLLALAGNTGYSTGPHTHIQYKWVRENGNEWQELEKNQANNSFNPEPFRDGTYAVDYAK